MQRGSALIPILLISLVVLTIGFFFYSRHSNYKSPVTPAVSEEKLKQYTNEQFGFKFEYSDKELSAVQDSEEDFNQRGNGNFRKNFKGYVGYEPGKFLGAVAVLEKINNYDTNPLTVWVFDNPDELSVDAWYAKYWYYPFVWGDFTYTGKFTLAPKDEATISGQPAKSGIIDYQPGKPKFIYLAKDKKMYLFRIIGETGNRILSTVKLL